MDENNQTNPVTIQEVNVPDPQPSEGRETGVNTKVQGDTVSQQNTLKEASDIKVNANNEEEKTSKENKNNFKEENEINVPADNNNGTVVQQISNRHIEESEIKGIAGNEDGIISQQNSHNSNKDSEKGVNSKIQGTNENEQNSSWLEYISKEPENNLPPIPKEDYHNDDQNNSESIHLENETTKKKKKGFKVAKLSYYFNSELEAMQNRVEVEETNHSYPAYYDNDVAIDQSQDEYWNHDNHTWNEVDPYLNEGDPPLNRVHPHLRTKPQNFMVYKQRWVIVSTLALLNFSNASLWINVAPISTIAAAYFNRTAWEVNFFSIIYMIVTIPFTFIATYVIKKTNLRTAMYLGAVLNAFGAIIRAAAMVPSLDINMQFYLSLIGQTFCAMALSFLLYLPAKIAQSWFPETQRVLATTIGSIATPIGIIAINIVAPIIVDNSDHFPNINYVCLVPALLAETMVIFCVNRSHPPTPPSESARQETRKDQLQQRRDSHTINLSYSEQLHNAFCNLPYFLLVQCVGGGLGLFSVISTVSQQMLCTVGYSDIESGLSIACMLIFGFIGVAVITAYASKTGFLTNIAKACWAGCAFFGVFMMEMYLIPNQALVLCIFSSLFGFFGVGSFSIGLELAVEATYPVDPAITTGFIYLWGQIEAVIVILLVSVLGRNISHSDNSVCNPDLQLKDYTPSILLLMVLLTVVTCIAIIFFKTSYKRRDAERQRLHSKT